LVLGISALAPHAFSRDPLPPHAADASAAEPLLAKPFEDVAHAALGPLSPLFRERETRVSFPTDLSGSRSLEDSGQSHVGVAPPLGSVHLRPPAPVALGLGDGSTPRSALSASSASPDAVPSLQRGVAFEGLRFDLRLNPWSPPDVQIAVGDDHVVEMVNLQVGVWSKDGAPLGASDLHAFFLGGPDDLVGDPKVRYDAASGRWFASAFRINTTGGSGGVRLAVSTSSVPTLDWSVYEIPAATACPDQPLLGFSDDKIVVTANDFIGGGCAGGFAGVQIFILRKDALVQGEPVPFVATSPDRLSFSIHPVTSLSPTRTQYMVSTDFTGGDFVRLFGVEGVPPEPVTLRLRDLPVSPYRIPPDAGQRGTGRLLATGDARILDAMWDGSRLWYGLNTGCVPSGDSRLRSCLRLVEIDTTDGILDPVLQDFDVGAFEKHYFYPAMRTDAGGGLVVTFGLSSSEDYPGMAVGVRTPGAPSNVLERIEVVRVGEDSETTFCRFGVCRYGDYFGAAVDPADTSRIWLAGEYGAPTGWATYIVAVREGLGLLRVTTNPPVPGKIFVDGIPRDEWGLTWLKLEPGPHVVSFGDLYGLGTPAPIPVTVISGRTTEVRGDYVVYGSLRVTTEPALPATVFVDGLPANDWGIWRAAPAGNHTLSFGKVAGFDPPGSQTVTIREGELTHVVARYTANPDALGEDPNSFGLLRVTTSPPVPSQIVVDGSARDEWGLTWAKVPPGTYEVSFRGVYGVTAPPAASVVVAAGRTAEIEGAFREHGSLRILTSPALPATVFVDGVPRNDWGMWQSVDPGTYVVSFESLDGYDGPTPKSVTVLAGELTTLVGIYTSTPTSGTASALDLDRPPDSATAGWAPDASAVRTARDRGVRRPEAFLPAHPSDDAL
jgi:hypothetical protein